MRKQLELQWQNKTQRRLHGHQASSHSSNKGVKQSELHQYAPFLTWLAMSGNWWRMLTSNEYALPSSSATLALRCVLGLVAESFASGFFASRSLRSLRSSFCLRSRSSSAARSLAVTACRGCGCGFRASASLLSSVLLEPEGLSVLSSDRLEFVGLSASVRGGEEGETAAASVGNAGLTGEPMLTAAGPTNKRGTREVSKQANRGSA